MPRATPMPPEARRAALIAATEPLLERFGRDVSTKQIAEAAAVAEGTIFRVFPTKEALIDAVCDQVFDVERICTELRAISLDVPLDARLTEAVGIMQVWLRQIFSLFHALRLDKRLSENHDDYMAKQRADNQRLNDVLVALLRPDASRIRLALVDAAEAIRITTLAFTHPWISDQRPHEPRLIVELLLHGVLGTPGQVAPVPAGTAALGAPPAC